MFGLSSMEDSYFLVEHLANQIPFSLAPYERRVIELLRNSKDKRARKLAKKRVRRTAAHHVIVTSRTNKTIARYLRPCQEEGRRAPTRHRRCPPCSLNGLF